MIRHAGCLLAASPPVLPLVVVMVELSARTLLVPFIGIPTLLAPGSIAALDAAITVPAITVLADEKHCVAVLAATNSNKECRFAMDQRHT